MKYYEEFMRIARTHIKREGVNKLLERVANSDFFIAPASTRYHHSFEGGLVQHSVEVFEFLKDEVSGLVSMESIAIVALFHDLCKMGYYKIDTRNVKDERGKWIQVPYYTVEDKFPYGHGEKSVFLLQDCIKLTVDEAMAIRWHMGLSVPKEDQGTMSTAFKEFPLALYLHIADMKSTYLE